MANKDYNKDAWKNITSASRKGDPQFGLSGAPFDNMANWGWNPQYRQNVIKWVQELSGVDSVLDIGCNQGQYLYKLREEGLNCELAGVDVNPDGIKVAKDKCASKNIKLDVEDARKLSFSDQQFHTVLLLGVLMHMPDPIEVLNEAARVAGSYLIISSFGATEKKPMHWNGFMNWFYTKQEVIGFMNQSVGRWSLEEFKEFEEYGMLVYQYKFKRINKAK